MVWEVHVVEHSCTTDTECVMVVEGTQRNKEVMVSKGSHTLLKVVFQRSPFVQNLNNAE